MCIWIDDTMHEIDTSCFDEASGQQGLIAVPIGLKTIDH
jgi:hypothetical protein